ncbi:PorP/SprF family type IX secretion system membrane protein [Marinoscillum furvescens]|uniref:Type IX secretion system PorP/SprF family membrane protein n=1 Tax=Marinoscillum furvescens DSM 4134 TaxID=1122208 RepID=A0A3D9L5V1_MARFU|nr:type IX secretion system membrane protein PorP/SprF [Marinoscillum furvescens]RED98983.1 type IX secretion system PorP/SprF family membrane protein [Marinoscillum furvescens DSM 4134]
MKTLTTIILLVIGLAASAQQEYMFTQYMFNGLAINPAYAGSHEALSVTAMHRDQWVGMDGAPSTQTLAVHSPIRQKHIAVGALFVRDQIGVTTDHTLFGSYAYKIDHHNYHLSFGLQAGFSMFNNDLSNVQLTNQDDQRFYGNGESAFLPNAGVGVYFYLPQFYAGLSVPQLFTNKYSENSDRIAGQVRHYFLTVGAVFPISRNVKWKPNLMMRAADRSGFGLDINSSFLFNDIVWIGASYRHQESVDIIFELQLSAHFRFGYAYDISTNGLNNANAGSHELVINYRFTRGARRLMNPRNF